MFEGRQISRARLSVRLTTTAVIASSALAAVAALPAAAAAKTTPNPSDQLTYQKAQQYFQIAPGQQTTVHVACPDGSTVLDGSALVQQVDQATGVNSDVAVVHQSLNGPSEYAFIIYNPTSGSTQGQAFVNCVNTQTNQGTKIGPIGQPFHQLAPVTPAHPTTATLRCPAGDIAVDPSWDLPWGAHVAVSEPVNGGSAWKFVFDSTVSSPAAATLSCLPTQLGHHKVLTSSVISGSTTGSAGQQGSQDQLICPVGTDGVVGGWSTNGVLLGDEPQDRSRVFSFAFPGADGSAQMTLDCLGNTTSTVSRR